MHRRSVGTAILVALACLVLFPLAASAQSSIVGLVRDESGGVLPGVSVEAASPVLIEKVRTGVTDDQGRYRLIDLRPGTYRVTFALPGFSTVVRDGVELPANFTATVNVDLKVGSLQESVTVSGAVPVVDVQQASRTQVVTRDLMDTLPTTRNIFSVGQIVPGIRQQVPDVGGSRSMEQAYMRAHGVDASNVSQLVDGMMINSYEPSGQLAYWDDALSQEVSVTTTSISADTMRGGPRISIVPKDGGNVVSGAVFLGGSNGVWQSDNVTDKLRARGITRGNGIAHIQNLNGAMGGPVMRDKLWFFMSVRHTSTDETVANVPKEIILPNGTIIRSILDQFVRDGALRLTWQVNQKNKFATWFQRVWKRKGKDFGFGTDPRAASQRDETHQNYHMGQAKWTSTPSSRFLLEAGYSEYMMEYTAWPQPEVRQARWTPAWYAGAGKTDTALNMNFYPDGCAYVTGCTSWGTAAWTQTLDQGHEVSGSGSYVTGTHNLKVGFQDRFGKDDKFPDRTADLVQNYVNGRPSTVTVYNTPMIGYVRANELGIYAQDSWTIKRLTLNPGVRVQWFNSRTLETSMGRGRFAPARFFQPLEDTPDWGPDWAPRFSAVYDLFGNGRTAVKANYSRYYTPWTSNFVLNYTNSVQTSDSRNWFDTDLIPGTSTASGVALPTNGDNIAQDNEIGPTSSTTFGLRSDRNPAPGIQNSYNWETSAAVQHQLMTGVSVTAGYFRRTYGNLMITDRTLITLADYTSFTVPMPSFANDPTLTGVLNPNEVITVYNLLSSKRSVYSSAQVDFSSTGAIGGEEPNQSIYNGVEVSFSARFARSTVLGGWTMEKNISVYCDTNDNPNGATTSDLYQGSTVSNGGRFCDMRQFSVPFRHEFKLSGNVPLPYSVSFGAVLQSYPGSPRAITWQPAASLFPGGRTNAETIMLTKPGTLFQDRFNQLDVNFKKNFRYGRKQFSVQFDMFNALNGSAILGTNNSIGASLGVVTSILQGRMPRVAFQMQF